MIAKPFRIPGNDIIYLLKKGESTQSVFFIIRQNKNNLDHLRASVIVSKKLIKKAVYRNKLRRRIYEAFRLIIKENDTLPSKDIILIPKTGILKTDFWKIKKDLLNFLLHEQIQQNPN
jgi:ribonuclease P protein component